MRRVARRQLGLFGLLLVLLWLVGVRGYSDYLARVLPERALALNPSQPEALLRAAESALLTHRLGEAENLAREALRIAPMSGPALRVLGAVAEARGDQARARQLIELAVAVTPRDTAGQFWLAINALVARDLGDCLRRLDRLLRFEPQVEPDAFPILATIAVSPAGVGAIAGTLAQDPPWRGGFMQQLIYQAPAATDVLRLFRAISAEQGKVHPGEWDALIARLIAANDWIRLRRLLSAHPELGSANTLVHDGAFDGDGHGPVLGWNIGRVPGADAMISEDPSAAGNRALRLQFHDRRVPFRHVSQLLLLQPGPYRLTGRVRLVDLQTPRGLAWTLTCTPGQAVIGKSELLSGSSDWRAFDIQFQVPEDNCGGQSLVLAVEARIAAEQQIVGEAWFDDLQIAALAPRSSADAAHPKLETVTGSR